MNYKQEQIIERLEDAKERIQPPYHDAVTSITQAGAETRTINADKKSLWELRKIINDCHDPLTELHDAVLESKLDISYITTGGLLDNFQPITAEDDARADAMYGMASANRELNRKIYWPLGLSSSEFEKCPRDPHSGEPDPFSVEGTLKYTIETTSGIEAHIVIDERGLSI